MLNDREPDPHVCIVKYDCLISKDVMGAWLEFVYVSNRTFSSIIFLLEFSFPSNSSISILPTGKQTMHGWSRKKLSDIEAG